MERTVITKSDDGNLLITREARMGTPGCSKDRRQRARFLERDHSYNPWKRVDRIIVRPGKPVPEGAYKWMPYWQAGLYETDIIAELNGKTSQLYVQRAAEQVEEIEQQAASFVPKPAKRIRVVLVEEDPVQSQEACQRGEHAFKPYFVGGHKVEYCACGATR